MFAYSVLTGTKAVNLGGGGAVPMDMLYVFSERKGCFAQAKAQTKLNNRRGWRAEGPCKTAGSTIRQPQHPNRSPFFGVSVPDSETANLFPAAQEEEHDNGLCFESRFGCYRRVHGSTQSYGVQVWLHSLPDMEMELSSLRVLPRRDFMDRNGHFAHVPRSVRTSNVRGLSYPRIPWHLAPIAYVLLLAKCLYCI